jgi:hypothetical protein
MKKWALVILPLLIIIIFIGLCLFRGHKRVMEPELTGFFGGIDQGMTRNQTKKIESELSSYSYDFSFYYGRSENNPILNLDLTFYDKYLIRQFIGTAPIDEINASFHKNYIDAGGETSFEYWSKYFQNRLGKKPLHYFYQFESENLKVDINLWHFEDYSFEIRKYARGIDIYTKFFAYFDDDYIPDLTTVDELYIINQKGDTLSVAKYRPLARD